MNRREELLRGIVRVNNERIDRQSPEGSSESQVPTDGRAEENQSTGESGALPAPTPQAVPSRKESVHEFAARREGEIRDALQEIEDREARLRAELEGLSIEGAQLCEELDLLFPLLKKEEVNDEDSSGSVAQPEKVSGDNGDRGTGGSGQVRSKRSGRSRGVARRGPPK